jgi:hypothetical protein
LFAKGPDELLRRLDDPGMRAEIRREMETGTGWEDWFDHVGHDWERVVIAGIEDPAFQWRDRDRGWQVHWRQAGQVLRGPGYRN